MEADDIQQLVSRLFALMTAKAEDAATLAVEGQGRVTQDVLAKRGGAIASLGTEITTLAKATLAILSEGRDSSAV